MPKFTPALPDAQPAKVELIIDDLKGRKFAQQLGLTITGTFGVLLEAKRAGIVPLVKPVLDKIKQTNFRLSAKLEALLLTQAEE